MVSQTFEYFVDLQTDTTKVQVIKITCGGEQVKQRLLPFFSAYKYYKLGSVTARFMPAATLPVDPTGLSYEAGENTVDPRDQFNAGLVRITNGEDFYEPSDTDAQTDGAMDAYYSMFLDHRWYKFQLQQGIVRSAKPLFWDVGQVHQDQFPGMLTNVGTVDDMQRVAVEYLSSYLSGAGSSPYGLFQTGMKQPMGWLPTDAYQNLANADMAATPYYGLTSVPEVELMRIVLPKAYKTKFFYRLIIRETVYFKDPVVINPFMDGNSVLATPLDRFVRVKPVVGQSPTATTTDFGYSQQFDNDGAGGGVF